MVLKSKVVTSNFSGIVTLKDLARILAHDSTHTACIESFILRLASVGSRSSPLQKG